MIGIFRTVNGADVRLLQTYNGLKINDPADPADDTYEVNAAAAHPQLDSIDDPNPDDDGTEIYKSRKVSLVITISGTIRAPSIARLYDKVKALVAAFDPAKASHENPLTQGFLPFDFSVPTLDTTTYPTGLVPSRYYARARTLFIPTDSEYQGTSTFFQVELQLADPRRYEQTAGTLALGSGYVATVLATSGLVSLWLLGEAVPGTGTAVDANAAAHNGTYVASPTGGVAGALLNDPHTAVTFNGTSQYVTVPDSAGLDLGDTLSIEAWVLPGVTGGVRAIITKGGNGYEFVLDTTNRLQFTKGEVADIVASTIVVPSGWHHVTVTKNGATSKLYIDAVDVTGAVTNATLADTAFALFIAARTVGGSPGGFANGSRQAVALYNVAISAATVSAHYAAAIADSSVANHGDYRTWPTLTITHTGAGNAAWTVVRTGTLLAATTKTLVLDLTTCQSGDVVVVDMAAKSIKRTRAGVETSVPSLYVSGAYFEVEPGTQNLAFANTTNTTIGVSWKHAYCV